jgi:hypothetical protein
LTSANVDGSDFKFVAHRDIESQGLAPSANSGQAVRAHAVLAARATALRVIPMWAFVATPVGRGQWTESISCLRA